MSHIQKLRKFIRSFGLSSGVKLFLAKHLKRYRPVQVPGLSAPVMLRPGQSDWATFSQIFIEREYAIRFPFSPQYIIDGGANIGLFTALMKNKHPLSEVICVEPDEDNFAILQKNVQAYDNVHCEHAGLWPQAGKLHIYDKYRMGKWGMVVEEDAVHGKIIATSIPDLMERYNWPYIDVLKLDIETSEKVLFSRNYEEWLPKVRMLIVELHDFAEPGCAQAFFTAINNMLPNYSYWCKGENTIIINNSFIDSPTHSKTKCAQTI